MEIVGKGTWIDLVGHRVVEREKSLGRSLNLIRVESGIGASGIPHVGSLADAARAAAVKLALENLGYRSEFIAFSDDLDGLRKVPYGLPEWLSEYLAFPVSSIPDPYKCHESYGAHMSSILMDAMDRCGIQYTFMSGLEAYKRGIYNSQIAKILENVDVIGKAIEKITGQTKFEEQLPYFPICENCGRIYLPKAREYDRVSRKVIYRCEGAEIRKKFIQGCGHEGEVRVTDGCGKLAWKVEFAARWAALDIRYEAYGKDIADSVKVNDWVSDNVLNYPHPYHVRYEMFLDKGGKKISKSAGNVFTPQTWLRYGTPQSLLLLLYKRIAGTRALSVSDIPGYMDEVDKLEQLYFTKKGSTDMKEVKARGLYEYINLLRPADKPSQHVPYSLLVQLCSVAPEGREIEYVENKLRQYGMINVAEEKLKKKIELALNWSKDMQTIERKTLRLNEKEKQLVTEFVDSLSSQDPKQIQYAIFEIARKHSVEPKDFFKLLYMILLGTESGPRLGPYLVDLGVEKARQTLLSSVTTQDSIRQE
ncbi:MAG: lysine--tRNA ligase [Nitrososphaeria archaeon]